MQIIETLRQTVEQMAAKAIGRNAKQPASFQGQTAAADFIAIVMTLPTDVSGWRALQDADTGELTYMGDGDPLDSRAIG